MTFPKTTAWNCCLRSSGEKQRYILNCCRDTFETVLGRYTFIATRQLISIISYESVVAYSTMLSQLTVIAAQSRVSISNRSNPFGQRRISSPRSAQASLWHVGPYIVFWIALTVRRQTTRSRSICDKWKVMQVDLPYSTIDQKTRRRREQFRASEFAPKILAQDGFTVLMQVCYLCLRKQTGMVLTWVLRVTKLKEATRDIYYMKLKNPSSMDYRQI